VNNIVILLTKRIITLIVLSSLSTEIQFLICGECQSSKEVAVSKNIIDELSKLMAKVGYTLTNSQLELQCLCDNCSASAA